MGPLTVALEQLLLDKIANSGMIGNKSKVRCSPIAVSALLAFIGTCFLIVAAYMWMIKVYNPEVATAYTGLLIIFFGVLIALGAYAIHEYKKSRINHYKGEFTNVVQSVLGTFAQDLEDPIRDNPKMAVALSILAGFILSRNIL